MPNDRWMKEMFTDKGTGTVPKMMYRNNGTHSQTNRPDIQNHHLSNNLDLSWQRQNCSARNFGRTLYDLNPYSMDVSVMEDRRQNDLVHVNIPGRINDAVSTSSSSVSNSRRDSLGTIPKCDNVKKYPDKKQMEDQLNQIREYLRVTTSLMSTIKNNDDQHAIREREQFKKIIKDLKDSEAKLVALVNDPLYDNSCDLPLEQIDREENHNMDLAVSEHMQRFSQLLDILACHQDKFNNIYNTNNGHLENGVDNISECNASAYQRNELEEKVELTNRKVQLLREQQNALINLKSKAENQLSVVQRIAEENQLLAQQQRTDGNQLRNANHEQVRMYSEPTTQTSIKNYNETSFDPAIKELEDRINEMKNDSRHHHSVNGQENGIDQVYLRERLDSSNQLLHILENRDGQLTNDHIELQQKLNELQIKKTQIDQLAQQLQNLGDEEDEDIGNQVRKIVTMKQQLSSLKDLLEVVKNTEFSLLNAQNVNELDAESHDNSHSICTKTDNIRQNVRINQNHNAAACNSIRANEQWLNEKDSNKALIGIQEREKVLAELKAKKRELEEIMYKQKDRASINNDVCSEISVNKSETSTNNNVFDASVMSWLPVHPLHNQIASAYSSDDCPEDEANEYSDLNSAISVTLGNLAQSQAAAPSHISAVNVTKPRVDRSTRAQGRSLPNEFIQRSSPITSEQRAASASTSGSAFEHERPSTNGVNTTERNKVQVQKQLELIQQLCQSLLDQQASGNVPQFRNNLSPSPLYGDPRIIAPINQQVSACNYINPAVEMPFINSPQINPQYFALSEVTNNQNILTANTLQTQAFLLNTVNQCCQMLWFQQREIASLRNVICSIQDQMVTRHIDQEMSEIPSVNPYIFPSQPAMFRSPSQPRNTTPKVNQVSSACSMPNLNPSSPHSNLEGAYMSQNNIRSSPSARLLDSSLNNLSNQNLMGEQPANNTVLPSVNVANVSMNHSLPTQIWNGQALNNQVPPGNRANNYWDNFRSYSRQNLLSASTKSNEGLQNPITADHSNVIYDRSQSLSLPPCTPPKLNMVHNESTNMSGENTPRRHLQFKTSQNASNSTKPVSAFPPDVLNINHGSSNQKTNDNTESAGEMLLDLSVGDSHSVKDQSSDRVRNQKEWNESEQSINIPKSKLFEELRDNVYKEVANLISANESRPHFLIQLFRDLQHINSDSMRGRTLQSIQTVLTHSLITPEIKRGANRQSSNRSTQANTQQDTPVESEHFLMSPSLWPPQSIATTSTSTENTIVDMENADPSINNILKPIITFLNNHKDEILHQELLELFKGLFMKSIPFTEIFTHRNIQEQTFVKHFAIILNESFEKYKGRRISEICNEILKTVSDILVGELSFIYLIQESIPESNCEPPLHSNSNTVVHNNMKLPLHHQNIQVEDGHMPQMQNGDLAEADQSRIEPQDEEEGAVGGILDGVVDVSNNTTTDQVRPDLTDLPKIDFIMDAEPEVEFMEQGLDQVPTRLSTKSRSHSNTPSRDRSSSRTDTLEHF